MKRIGMSKRNFEMILLDLTEGVLIGGLAGFLLGTLIGTMVWCVVWQMMPTVSTLSPALYAGQLGTFDGVIIGAVIAFCWRLKLVLGNSQNAF